MQIYKSIVAYDGTKFAGFQRQAQGQRTVQAEFESALGKLGWEESSLKAAGRTDAGVHARGQVISFALSWRATMIELTNALNANLPRDIGVQETERAQAEFHPRFSALRRRYQYSIYYAATRDPLRERSAWRIWPELDVKRMNMASELLLGTHDFGAFGTAPIENGNTEREIFRAFWEQNKPIVVFDVEATAFLYHMVRRLVAALVSIGKKQLSIEEFRQFLEIPTKGWERSIAPPSGLSLEEVKYP
ncbi:MAG: tRNA pseudouridine(38-40) synthase TruA [Chloroflexi bacterium]|nr:tRNA pseudouridine(38-40) synthase TruA [Chloroflexota bacterium]